MATESTGRIVGIDLGTTNSVVAVLDESTNEPTVISNPEGGNKTPSIVAFAEDGEILVGEIARRQVATNPSCSVTAVKRMMGRYYSDIEGGNERFPFELANDNDQLLINILHNGVDAAIETGGNVRVGWNRKLSHLQVWVDDDGPGLPDTGNLFVPFFTTKPTGSGIGLVLSRQIAEAHGGTLTLENREGSPGCRALLRLPLKPN